MFFDKPMKLLLLAITFVLILVSCSAGTGTDPSIRKSLTFSQLIEKGGLDGLNGAYSVAVSGDGKNVYVAGSDDDAIAVFRWE